MNLPMISWSEAQNRQLASARAFAALGIPAGTIRRWAHEQRITAVAKAPGGPHLYVIAEVSAAAGIRHAGTDSRV